MDYTQLFSGIGSIIFLIDVQVFTTQFRNQQCQEDYSEALKLLSSIMGYARNCVSDSFGFEVFIHKVDGLTESMRIGNFVSKKAFMFARLSKKHHGKHNENYRRK